MKKENAPHDLLIFDTETTDKMPRTARIATCYMGLQGRDGKMKREWSWTINPGIPMPDEAAEINGLTTEYLIANGRTDLTAVISEIYRVLLTATKKQIPIVAFNLPYDLTVVDREMRRQKLVYGVTKLISGQAGYFEPAIFFDPLIWSREHFQRAKGGHKQFKVAERLGIEVDQSRLHDAKYDVELAGKIAWRFLQRYTQNYETMRDVQAALPGMNEEWARGMSEYFARVGKTEDDGSPVVIQPAFPYYEPDDTETEYQEQIRRYK